MSAPYWWVRDEHREERCMSLDQHPYVTAREYEIAVERGDRLEAQLKLVELNYEPPSLRGEEGR